MTTKYLPSDIKSKALREIYYKVQKIIADRYENAVNQTTDKNIKRALKEQFNKELRDTITYYVNLSGEV